MAENNESKVIKYHPSTRDELKELVDDKNINLGEIDVSKITDMSKLFYYSFRSEYSGIENWDVSNVTDMEEMFYQVDNFNADISRWNVSTIGG